MMQTAVSVSPMEWFGMGKVTYGARSSPQPDVLLMGTNENMMTNFSYELEIGRFITQEDVQYARPITVLGSQLAKDMFPNETPIGKTIRMRGQRYQVIGVLVEKGNLFGFSQDNRMFVPITKAFAVSGNKNRDISISVSVFSQVNLAAAMEEVTGRLRVIRKVEPGSPNNFEIATNNSMQAIFEGFTATLTAGGAAIGLIALLAAGIGIMNIMLVSVTERTREIGIRKSVGARRRDILRQFLLEAFFLCQIGGILGIALGALAGNGVALLFDISPAFPMGWAIGTIVMVTGIAMLFGGYPAYLAARLHPIESLRHE